MEDRLPPQNTDAERALLGSILIEPDTFMMVSTIVTGDDFYRWKHQTIFKAMERLALRNVPADIVLVGEEIEREKEGLLAEVSEAYITGLVNDAFSSTHANHYAGIVSGASIRREMIIVGEEIRELAAVSNSEPRDILSMGQNKLSSMATRGGDSSVTIRSILDDIGAGNTIHNIEPISTGLKNLDDVLKGGYRPTQLVTVGGRTAVGKTTFLINLMAHAAKAGLSVAFFSLEMDKYEIGEKLIALRTRELPSVIRNGQEADPVDPYQYAREWGKLGEDNIYVNDFPTRPRLSSLVAEARQLSYRHGLDVLYVDYAQLIDATSGKDMSRVAELTLITRTMKQLAKELQIPVVMGAQLRRIEPNPRTGNIRAPQLSDFRESGSIEQDSDICILLSVADDGDKVLCDIQKNRSGPIGKRFLDFQRDVSLFLEPQYVG